MKTITQNYIHGQFVKSHGTELFDLVNPSNQQIIGKVTLGDEVDAQAAIAAAKAAFKTFSKTTVAQRIEILQRLHESVKARESDLVKAMIEEYGAPISMATRSAQMAADSFLVHKKILETFEFDRNTPATKVRMEPLGVVALITPWNSNASFICGKFATALSAGCTVVVKPSEMSALQTEIVLEAIHAAELPKGLFNLVNGRGDIVGAEFTRHLDVAKISFTGSTLVGKTIARGAADTLKRVTLELGGKSPNLILDDADLEKAIPMALIAAYMNSGQACVAGSRLLVPENRLEEVKRVIKRSMTAVKVGQPSDSNTTIGPMVSVKQYERVQSYIKLGMEEGAEILVGGLGQPEGLEKGNFVKATVFTNVTNQMRIAREEIFGPVLSVITYRTEAEAIEIANDTTYGLAAYVSSADQARANRVASQLEAGRVHVNDLGHDPFAPFGGFKQSGIGREFGTFGIEAYLEPRAILG